MTACDVSNQSKLRTSSNLAAWDEVLAAEAVGRGKSAADDSEDEET